MKLAAKYGRPNFYVYRYAGRLSGLDAEERGQAEAIALKSARNGPFTRADYRDRDRRRRSGGALAIANRRPREYSGEQFLSVISPEGCAAIMWRDSSKAETAAVALKITATDLKELGIIDEIVPEPEAGAHTDYEEAARLLDVVLDRAARDAYQRAGKRSAGIALQEIPQHGSIFRFRLSVTRPVHTSL